MFPVSMFESVAAPAIRFVLDAPGLLAQAQQEAAPNPISMLGPLAPLLLLGVAFYFMIYLPQSRERKALEQKLSDIKKNDQVVTSGGIVATVVQASADSKYVTVRIDDNNNTKIKILRSAIVHVGAAEEDEDKPKKE
jgi:preprotein translocase subunit YajC